MCHSGPGPCHPLQLVMSKTPSQLWWCLALGLVPDTTTTHSNPTPAKAVRELLHQRCGTRPCCSAKHRTWLVEAREGDPKSSFQIRSFHRTNSCHCVDISCSLFGRPTAVVALPSHGVFMEGLDNRHALTSDPSTYKSATFDP